MFVSAKVFVSFDSQKFKFRIRLRGLRISVRLSEFRLCFFIFFYLGCVFAALFHVCLAIVHVIVMGGFFKALLDSMHSGF
jgi:hypothetical protein